MAVSKNNTIFVYRSGDTDSLTVAQLYQTAHELDSDHLVAISCSDTEILGSEAAFNSQVLDPIKNALAAQPLNARTIWAIVLGYNVPGGFRHGDGDIVSSVSRVSRIHHSFAKKTRNFLFNRQVFKRFDATDADFALITSRIDAPTRALAEGMVNNAVLLNEQKVINGTFYFDEFAALSGKQAEDYKDDLFEFRTKVLSSLNLTTFLTVFLDPYVDVVIPFVQDDSFVWAWFSDRSSLSFFRDTNALRIFFYNADFDGAVTVRDTADRRWAGLAIQKDYLSTAGAMSNPTVEGFLRPKPFFESLLQGSTLGEAFLFSTPFVDWTMTFFGDPLASVQFPATAAGDAAAAAAVAADPTVANLIDEDESWRRMAADLGKAIAYLHRHDAATEAVRDRILTSSDVATEVDLLLPAENLQTSTDLVSIDSDLNPASNGLFSYVEQRNRFTDIFRFFPTINDYLAAQGFRVGQIVIDSSATPTVIDADNIFASGRWEFEFPLIDEAGAFAFYNFELDISSDAVFGNLLFQIKTLNGLANWTYEKDVNEFVPVPVGGVPSNFVGRRIRYESLTSQFLPRMQTYFVRVRQRDEVTTYDYQLFGEDIIFT